MFFQGEVFWLIMTIIFCVFEGVTFALVSVWFAGGAIASLIAAVAGLGPLGQYTVFVVVSALLLVFTRPIIKKYLSKKKTPTNADRLIGHTGEVIIDINPRQAQGQVKVDGQVWSAKTIDGECIGTGKDVEVLDIEGVKLVVRVKGVANNGAGS